MVSWSNHRFALTVFAIAYAPIARAQDMPVVPYAANFAQTRLHNELFVQPGVNAEIRRRAKGSGKKPALSLAVPPALTYRADLTQRAQNLKHFADGIGAQDAAAGASLAKLFASTDLIAAMDKEMAANGLHATNVADAYAMYWIMTWNASRGIVDGDISGECLKAVRDQAARAFASTPVFASSTNAKRQEFAELLLVQTILTMANVEALKNDKPKQRQLADGLKVGALAMGLDLDAMTLTEAGFVPTR